MILNKIEIQQDARSPTEMSFFRTKTHNTTWVITLLSKNRFYNIKKVIKDIDDHDCWNIEECSGVYILVGKKDNKPYYYVGQTGSWKHRWSEHKKKNWVEHIVFIQADRSYLNSDDIRFIEQELIKELRDNQRLSVENKTSGQVHVKSKHTNSLKRVINNVIIPGMIMLSVDGISAVKAKRKHKIARATTDEEEIPIFWVRKGENYKAVFFPKEQSVSLLLNQTITLPIFDNQITLRNKKTLNKMVKQGSVRILEETKNFIKFEVIKLTMMISTSRSAAMISGSSVNGWDVWKDLEGIAISRYKR